MNPQTINILSLKKFIFCFVSSLISISLYCQCPVGDVIIEDQSDVDDFAINYGNCDTLMGSLTLPDFGILVNDISAFSNLEVIQGDLTISYLNQAIADLTGFSQLKEVGGDLKMQAVVNLNSLQGLENLERVDGDFELYGCDSMPNLNGLNSLSVIGGHLYVHDMVNFELAGLNQLDSIYGSFFVNQSTPNTDTYIVPNSLQYIGGYFNFSHHDIPILAGGNSLNRVGGISIQGGIGQDLENITAFDNLAIVEGDFTFFDTQRLSTINGFNMLDSIGGTLSITGSDSLLYVHGFSNLEFIETLRIDFNPFLTDITAFDHQITIPGSVQIDFNPLLSYCHVQAVCDHLSVGNTPIFDNNIGCNSQQEVIDMCCGELSITLSIDGTTISVDQSGESYQWIDCDNDDSEITGATSPSYTAVDSGSYAVILSNGLCSDTSACAEITLTGIFENAPDENLQVYPNPSSGIVSFQFESPQEYRAIKLFTIQGELLNTFEIRNSNYFEIEMNQSSGFYIIEITDLFAKSTYIKICKE